MLPYLQCMLVVAATAGLPPRVLPVIQVIEGGDIGTSRQDANGTQDLGPMQGNTVWLSSLAARAGLSEAETRARLLNEPCFNIAAAALVLKTYLEQEHGALLPAIGDYHSHRAAPHDAYVAKAEDTALRLFGNRPGVGRSGG